MRFHNLKCFMEKREPTACYNFFHRQIFVMALTNKYLQVFQIFLKKISLLTAQQKL